MDHIALNLNYGRSNLIHFLVKSSLTWDDWKETETELHWYFERNFKAHSFDLRLTTDDGTFAIVVDLPPDQLDDFDKTFQNGDLEIAMDKIHGVVIDGKKKDAKIQKYNVTLGPARPLNVEKSSLESVEERVNRLELEERARFMDLGVIMEKLLEFQVEMNKKFESLEIQITAARENIEKRCEMMEKQIAKRKI